MVQGGTCTRTKEAGESTNHQFEAVGRYLRIFSITPGVWAARSLPLLRLCHARRSRRVQPSNLAAREVSSTILLLTHRRPHRNLHNKLLQQSRQLFGCNVERHPAWKDPKINRNFEKVENPWRGHTWSATGGEATTVKICPWRCAQTSDSSGSRSNRMQVKIRTSAFRQRHRNTNTTSILLLQYFRKIVFSVVHLGVIPNFAIFVRCFVLHARGGQRRVVRVECGYGCWLVGCSGRLSLSNHVVIWALQIRISEASEIS